MKSVRLINKFLLNRKVRKVGAKYAKLNQYKIFFASLVLKPL